MQTLAQILDPSLTDKDLGTFLAKLADHAKGGDYNESHLPERDVLTAWGGQVVLLPFLNGHSSSGLIALARAS